MFNLFSTTLNRHPDCGVKDMGGYGEGGYGSTLSLLFCWSYLINLNKLNKFC